MRGTELILSPATWQVRLLRSGEISAGELAEAYLAQIERLNPRLNAITDCDPESVRAQARVLDRVPEGERGPLHGLPVTIKSSISVAGSLCEVGSLLHAQFRPQEDAVLVGRLRRAGALLLGTTNCPEFLMNYHSENRIHGRTNNPWDLARTPGGSSGGEAAAIAAGLSGAGLGSDSGGSVRVPAHYSGICALKPTPGRLPEQGHLPPCAGPFASLGAIGPMARSVGDVELLFRTLAGASAVDPAGAPVALSQPGEAELRAQRIGLLDDDAAMTPETREALLAAAEALRARGYAVQPVRSRALDDLLEQARRLWWILFVRAGAMLFRPATVGREQELSAGFLEFLEIAEAEPPLTGEELLGAWVEADGVRQRLLGAMQECPVLLTPVCSVPAFRHGERGWQVGSERVEYLEAMRYTQWFNLLGAPATVVPVGRSPEGLPIGVQVAGRPWQDEVVLGIAGDLERDFGYRPPPLAT
ncbi:MAG TPA: amidase [Acidobacteriaceae bacterium]